MTLFNSDPQYREKETIWQVMSLLPLFGPLAAGHVWSWFAVNIPMDLGTGCGSRFTSDIDIIAKLRDVPPKKGFLYRTSEVKVGLLYKDGTAKSLKAGKSRRIASQLEAYRGFGAPEVSLLEAYVCEQGFLSRQPFPPPALAEVTKNRLGILRPAEFGYQLLPFEQMPGQALSQAFIALRSDESELATGMFMLNARVGLPTEPFSRLAERLDTFFDGVDDENKHFRQIIFCRACRQLGLVKMKEARQCPTCGADLVLQS
jgi:hypothetical protein